MDREIDAPYCSRSGVYCAFVVGKITPSIDLSSWRWVPYMPSRLINAYTELLRTGVLAMTLYITAYQPLRMSNGLLYNSKHSHPSIEQQDMRTGYTLYAGCSFTIYSVLYCSMRMFCCVPTMDALVYRRTVAYLRQNLSARSSSAKQAYPIALLDHPQLIVPRVHCPPPPLCTPI